MEPFGVLVFGYARPRLLRDTLESLDKQGALAVTHVFIDGDAGQSELVGAQAATIQVARSFKLAGLHAAHGHFGIHKFMLDGLTFMQARYDSLLVIEDDCFPVRDAISVFSSMLESIAGEQDVYSVYGHHFQVPSEGARFSRFQGWGWGTTAPKVRLILPELIRLFNLPEEDFLAWTAQALTPAICARLDVTPGRDVINVLRWMYSWDACTALVCAQRGLMHRKTPAPVIRNCGLTPGHGHFSNDNTRLRQPPFNMISPEEVWAYW